MFTFQDSSIFGPSRSGLKIPKSGVENTVQQSNGKNQKQGPIL